MTAKLLLPAFGFNAPELADGRRVGLISAYRKALERVGVAESSEPAFAHFKIRNSRGSDPLAVYSADYRPSITAMTRSLVSEAAACGFTPFVTWSPFDPEFAPGVLPEPMMDSTRRIRSAASRMVGEFPSGTVFAFQNEPDVAWDFSTSMNQQQGEDFLLAEAAARRGWSNADGRTALSGFRSTALALEMFDARMRPRFTGQVASAQFYDLRIYGQGGDSSAILPALEAFQRSRGPGAPRLFIGEKHYGFPGKAASNDPEERLDLYTAETGAYLADLDLALNATGKIGGATFTLDWFARDNSGKIVESFLDIEEGRSSAGTSTYFASLAGGRPALRPRRVDDRKLAAHIARIYALASEGLSSFAHLNA